MDFEREKEILRNCHEKCWDCADFYWQYVKLVNDKIRKTLTIYKKDIVNEDVEDISQIVFEKLFENQCKKLKEFKPEFKGAIQSWLAIISANTTKNYIRTELMKIKVMKDKYYIKDSNQNLGDFYPSEEPVTETTIYSFKQYFEQMPFNNRIIFRLNQKGMSDSDIAEIVELSLGRVRNILSEIKKYFVTHC